MKKVIQTIDGKIWPEDQESEARAHEEKVSKFCLIFTEVTGKSDGCLEVLKAFMDLFGGAIPPIKLPIKSTPEKKRGRPPGRKNKKPSKKTSKKSAEIPKPTLAPDMPPKPPMPSALTWSDDEVPPPPPVI